MLYFVTDYFKGLDILCLVFKQMHWILNLNPWPIMYSPDQSLHKSIFRVIENQQDKIVL